MKYDYKKTIVKGIQVLAFVGLPMILSWYSKYGDPAITGLTVGVLLQMAANWLKHRNK